tara:strand:- start:9427 stop:10056 length:630 start_codon:yes stop_codon:yes gene_type:complete
MKYRRALFIVIPLILLYSCKTGKVHQEFDSKDVQNGKTVINAKNIDCNYSKKSIGENSSSNSKVELIGLFENLNSNNGEHIYGYTLMIWKLENEIVGFLNIYEGSIEPSRSGPIILGKLTNDSFDFKVWTKENKSMKGWQQSDVNIFSFRGIKSRDKIIGSFSNFNCSKGEMHQNYDEKIELISSDVWELKGFKNIKEWKEEFSDKLDY